ncbi:MAG: undecaprenyldiphospho-muramoylpentapeptide beta-N-acetylglucosaminyltransferase [Saprospiraceae bacterium]|nr:undecaprenyldiphospho-muramoylpentapeptide beta-N-acetylglucosaminyltransferase [Saprospiraceae bacterium]MBK7811268.1 undecaprenyldiphospho-muramoylpentapeptide beta-N-acetylglucosaminyltransferase [Saprospiraceae bacterium]MBK9631030.1 undecaprenyldiphospho-muramoylpentapeptide beta-N-acetylglucosaminyltransferase [Saprospiraceae bacterium]
MKVLISGGGTGGHVFPAIAIADALKSLCPNLDILFVGALGKLEMTEVPKAGYKIIGLDIQGFQRKIGLAPFKTFWKLGKALLKSRSILKSFKPDVVVGVGGYASGAIMKAAQWSSIPTVIQEQNSYPGLTNRWMADHVNFICAAFEEVKTFFPKTKVYITGNPVRQNFNKLVDKNIAYEYFGLDSTKKTFCVFGGSLGAATMNKVILEALPQIYAREDIQILWQVGRKYEEEILKHKIASIKRVKICSFIDRMDYAYAIADIAIARAGALTIAELAITGTVSILVPSPNVTDDHQTKNAMSLVQRNAAILVKDENAIKDLWKTTISLSHDEVKRAEIKKNLLALAKPDAAKDIAQHIISLIPQK